jgi:pimeloyl-ACP methyl ester carboxylesterase
LTTLSGGLQGQTVAAVRTPAPLPRFDRVGSGPPLLLLHGFGGCAQTMGFLTPGLQSTYELIIPDLPGHGGSPRPAGAYTHRAAAPEIIRLMDSLGLRRVRAIGISSGGMILLLAMIQRPDLFDRVIIVGATDHYPPEARVLQRATTSLAAMPPFVQGMYRSCARGGEEQIDWLLRQFRGMADDTTDMNLRPADLQKISSRLLIVHGDSDPFFPADIPAAIHRAVPNSALWIIPFGDHVPIVGRQTAPFLEVATAFFSRP